MSNKTVSNNQWVKEEVTRENFKNIYFLMEENGNTTYENLWDVAKAVIRGKFRPLNIYIKKIRKISSHSPNLPP